MERVESGVGFGVTPCRVENPSPIQVMHRPPGSFLAPCHMETGRRMFMETVNGLAAPSTQGPVDARQPAWKLQADPWLKIIQNSGCENLNKQDWG